ncbi:MAG: hypothetical protein ACOY5W_13230 [Pseudomonadota bacterium]
MSNVPSRVLAAAIVSGLGIGVLPQTSSADIIDFTWTGVFTMLDPTGGALENTSLPKGSNGFQTPVSGTLQIDTVTGEGTAAVVPFWFFETIWPGEVVGFELQSIGDGSGGAGTLMLANMLFNWGGTAGIPVSLVLDAAGLYAAMEDPAFGPGSTIAGIGATPASDGTWTNDYWEYLALGPTPLATTDWNTSLAAGCEVGNCFGVLPSGALPLVADTAPNAWRYDVATGSLLGDGTGIGGSPMVDGPFRGYSINLDFTDLTVTTVVTPVPLPAALWMFCGGVSALLGGAWRRRCRS